MYKVLIGLFVVVLVTNPLSAQIIQPEVMNLWDLIIAKSGWITTLVFAVYLTGMAGYVFAKVQLKEKQAERAHVKKAKTNIKRNLGNMKYELTR